MKSKEEKVMRCETPAPRTATRCGPCSPSERNRYFRGKKLTVADFELEQDYLIERRRLINRTMLGWGVAEGFAIIPGEAGITVGPGMAFDARGRELVACEPVDLTAPDDLLWLIRGECGWTAGEHPSEPGDDKREKGEKDYTEETEQHRRYLLRAHYAEAWIDGIRVEDGCGDTRCEGNHVCETVVYSLTPDCTHGLPDCQCAREPSESEKGEPRWSHEPSPDGDPHIAAVHDRGPHDQLVDWSLARHDPHLCARPRLTKVGHLHVALDDGVPIACVAIAFACGKPHIAAPIDDHRARRLAYPNNSLFDLIRGCDLTRIQDVGWSRWLPHSHRRVPFDRFAAMFVAPPRAPAGPKTKRGRTLRPPVDTKFWVSFSGPVQTNSLTPDVLAMTIVQRDANEDVGTMYRVPVAAVAVADPSPGDPAGTTRAFRPLVAARFWEGEINPDNSSGFEGDTLVEIEVRTGFIVDARGQEVAGGGRYVPTDSCTPGGRFLSSFVVLAEEDATDATETEATPDTTDSIKPTAPQPPQEA
jgi:hypothetical protein